MMDSRGKNMMFACYDADPDNNIGHWLPIFYDMDTMLGLNNSGRLVYSYDVEDDQANLYNLAATYESTQYSVLWCNFKDAFQEDIKTMYNDLRNKNVFNINTFLKLYNERQGDAWSEVYLNEDADYKYIDPLVNNYTVEVEDDAGNTITKTASDYLYAAQGSRSQHRAYWLQRRFDYLDSKYDYAAKIGTSQSVLNVRLSSEIQRPSLPFNAIYNFTPKYNQYVTLSYQNSGSDVGGMVGPVRLYEGQSREVTMPIDTAKDQEAYFYGIENMKDIGLQADKYYQKFIITRPLNVTRLDIGTFIKDWENDGLGSKDKLTISDPTGKTAFTPFLEYLNIQNCSAVSDTMSLTQCPYLQELYAYGTNIPSITFFEGGNLKHLEMPATTTTLTLKGQLFFDTFTERTDEEVEQIRAEHIEKIGMSLRSTMTKNGATEEEIQAAINAIELTEIQRNHLTFENYDNLIQLRISNCPLVDSKAFVKKLLKLNVDGKSYRTNLRYFRMEDINWTITEDECEFMDVIEDGVSKHQIKNIPILDTLVKINGINNADSTIERQEAGNDYFAGTITIDNSNGNFGISEYILYNLYEKIFPNLKFKYIENNHCTKAYFIGINNALNQADSKYSKKIAATEIDDIASNLLDWFTPKKLEDGSWDATHVPPFTKTQNNKYEYKFIGWSIDKSKSFDEDNYADYATQLNTAKEACKILVTENENGSYTTSANNNFTISAESFNENQELHFYPIYLGIIRYYEVKFYWKRNNVDELLKKELVKFDHDATPPPAPMNVVLDETDKTKTMIYPFIGYDSPYTKIQTGVSTYAKFGEPVDMRTLSGDMISTDYFERNDNDPIDLPPGSIGIYIRKDFDGEALIIPKEFNGYPIRFIGTHFGEIPANLKRIYFEEDNEILAISGNFMNGKEDFEYLDFSALQQLTWIGEVSFQGCSNLYVPVLPDSVCTINNNAFMDCPGVCITSLPKKLEVLGTQAFQNCTGLKSLDINVTKRNDSDEKPQFTIISDYAFSGCTNLSIVGETIDCNITEIGTAAFEFCSNLVLNFEDSGSLNPLKKIHYRAFNECSNLSLNNLPNQLESIGNNAFGGKSGNNDALNTNIIPMSVNNLEIGAFMFRRLADKFNGLFIIENPNINISPDALMSLNGVKYILVPASVDTSVAPWNTKLGLSGVTYITSEDQMN